MSLPETARPTAKMIRLFPAFVERFGGEPEDIWVFDPFDLGATPPDYLRLTHVLTWPADTDCDVTSFQTLGMSDRPMPGTNTFAEFHLAIRADLDRESRLTIARFLANLAAYPFQWNLTLNWWEVIGKVGDIPGFEGCRHLLLHPRLTEEGFDQLEDEAGEVKILYVVPITPRERHLLTQHGEKVFREYLADAKIDLLSDRFDPPEWNTNEGGAS